MFSRRDCQPCYNCVNVNDVQINCQDSAIHLGHVINVKDKCAIIEGAKKQFGKQVNMFLADFGDAYAFIKNKLFNVHCCSFYGLPLWPLSSKMFDDICTALRKALRRL